MHATVQEYILSSTYYEVLRAGDEGVGSEGKGRIGLLSGFAALEFLRGLSIAGV